MLQKYAGEDKNYYAVPAPVVHKLIFSIFVSLFSIAGYLVVWAIADAKWKVQIENEQRQAREGLQELQVLLKGGILPVIKEQIENLEHRVSRCEAGFCKSK